MRWVEITVNVVIFACRNFHEFTKVDNFAWIYIRVFHNIASTCHNKNYFHVIHIFADFKNANNAKICTARTFLRSQYLHVITKMVYICNLNK